VVGIAWNRWSRSAGLSGRHHLERAAYFKGTYVSVEPFHLFRYLDEQAFRYNNRKPMNDAQRFSYLCRKIVGKRLTYDELTGKTGAERF